MAAWVQAFEMLRLMGITPEFRNSSESFRDANINLEISSFSLLETRGAKTSGPLNVYRVLGHLFLDFEDALYILDFSLMDQVHGCAKFWEGAYSYCHNYRLSGNLTSEKSDMVFALNKCISWIVKIMEEHCYSTLLSRSMKQSLALLQNYFHPHADKLEMGWKERSEGLKKEIANTLLLSKYWHEVILELCITDRAKLDMAHLYYDFPSPD